MPQDEYGEAVEIYQANVDAIDLTRRHCWHARFDLVGGNSFVGTALGLPIGPVEVRCEHATPSGRQGHQALALAIDFYNASSVRCAYGAEASDQ